MSRRRSAFTIVELVVVIAIIMVLVGMTYPLLSRVLGDSKEGATQVLIDAISITISARQERTVSGPDGKVLRMWDMNGDNILDGQPDLDPDFTSAQRSAASAAGWKGTIDASRREWDSKWVEKSSMRLVDSWRRPLHIRFSSTDYGSAWFGIWSDGPDGISGNADDIKSWKHSR